MGSSTRKTLVPGSAVFNATLSSAMALTALAIDSILPAFEDIRAEVGLAENATEVTILITAFMMGMGLGQLPAGLLADRYGRRPVLIGGVGIYLLGALGMILAPSLGFMAAARFVWGLGAAGPRVAATAMVRDSFEGEQMAKQMSNIMAVFLLVPMLAPGLGELMLTFGSWHYVVMMCGAIALAVLALTSRLPTTLAPEQRRALSLRDVLDSWKTVLAAPATIPYLVAITASAAIFLSYLASSENIYDDVFGMGDWFALIFGGTAICLAVANLGNGRVVERIGLDRMLWLSSTAGVALGVVLLGVSLATDGKPPFMVFIPLMVASLMSIQITQVNANTAAMIPLGSVAGSGAAVMGMVPLVGGALLGSLVDQQFDGSIGPLSVAIVITAVVGWIAVRVGASRVASHTALAK